MNEADLKKWRQAASIAAHVRDTIAAKMEPGKKLIDLSLEGHRLIDEMGGKPAFPLQMSRNHIAAHYCSYLGDETRLEAGDLVKIDCGVHVDGFVADTAKSVDLSPDGRHADLLSASKDALAAAIRTAGPEVAVADIGREVERAIRAYNLTPIRNLTGHGVGQWIVHKAPQIPNVPNGRGRLKAGTVVAIEPFASSGTGLVEERGDAHVFMAKKSAKKTHGADARVLRTIRDYNGLPFGSRDLLQIHPFDAVAGTLNALLAGRQLMVYPPLCDRRGSFVAQFEHTIYVHEDGVEVLTAARESVESAQGAVT